MLIFSLEFWRSFRLKRDTRVVAGKLPPILRLSDDGDNVDDASRLKRPFAFLYLAAAGLSRSPTFPQPKQNGFSTR